ncbi:hypothetical protein AKO1_008010 [Acrasis kona]|uniref:R3H domain-containing protein n=1 Tax=Acrasis kona TaxID=1008807 RepID=A0AAW2YPN6_9EUKA
MADSEQFHDVSRGNNGRGRGRGGRGGRGRGGNRGGSSDRGGRSQGGDHRDQQNQQSGSRSRSNSDSRGGRNSRSNSGARPHTEVNFFIVRRPLKDHNTNQVAAPIPSTIPPEPEVPAAKEFYQKLKSFVQEPGQVVYDFPNSLKLSQRQKVHALAEQFDLDHFSRGSNPFRYICAQKRNVALPDEWQYFGYVGLFGSSIDNIASSHVKQHGVDRAYIRKRVKRDGPIHHVTLMTRPEINSALKNLESIKEYEQYFEKEKLENGTEQERIEILLNVIGQVVGDDYQPLGLGKTVRAEEDNNVAYFVVINWPSAQELRKKLGLEPYHFHVTVAFKSNDIHGVSKDESTLLKSGSVESQKELAASQKDHVAELKQFLKSIDVSENLAQTFVNMGYLGVDTLKDLNEMDLFDLGVDSASDQEKILGFVKNFDSNIAKYQK